MARNITFLVAHKHPHNAVIFIFHQPYCVTHEFNSQIKYTCAQPHHGQDLHQPANAIRALTHSAAMSKGKIYGATEGQMSFARKSFVKKSIKDIVVEPWLRGS